MALTILPQDPGSIGSLGASLGTGLGQGLQMLAQQKFKDILEQKQKKGIAQTFRAMNPNLTEEQANFMSELPLPLQKVILEKGGLESAGQQMGQPGLQQGQSQIAQQMGNIGETADPYSVADTLGGFDQQSQPDISSLNAFKSLYGQGAGQDDASYLNFQQKNEYEPGISPEVTQSIKEVQKDTAQLNHLSSKKPEQGLKFKTSQQEKFKAEELSLKREELEDKKVEGIKDLKLKSHQASRLAKSDLRDLNRMSELNKSGKLDSAGYVEFLERSGLNLPALMNPESQEFASLRKNFFRGLKENFGSQLNQFEVEQFLRAIPSLNQTAEGRELVIENFKYAAHAKTSYNDTLNEILKDNKGVPPRDLLEQIDNRLDKKMEVLGKKFKENIKTSLKHLPKDQNRLVGAAQSVLGSVVGAPGALLKAIGGRAAHAVS